MEAAARIDTMTEVVRITTITTETTTKTTTDSNQQPALICVHQNVSGLKADC